MNTHIGKIQENRSNNLAKFSTQKPGDSNSALQFADNRPEIVFQRKLSEITNNNVQVVQLNSVFNKSGNLQQPFQFKTIGKAVAQLQHKKGESRVVEARKRKNVNKRRQRVRRREQQAQEAQELSESVSGWASWAWEKAKGVGLAVVKKVTGGIDPFEVVQNLRTVYNSNASLKTKVIVLALYGTYEVSNFLNENMATFIGGESDAMMKLEKEINEHIDNLSELWETGEIDEGQVEEGVADQLIEAFGGGGD